MRTLSRHFGASRHSRLGLYSLLLATIFLAGNISAAGLVWTTNAGYRFAPIAVQDSGLSGFTEMAPEATGITFSNVLSETKALTNSVYLNGSGVALGDVDGDGWCDIYLCGLDRPNVLYRNLGGWRFEDVTAAAGVSLPAVNATSAAFADLDGDGDLDLIVNTMAGGTFCFLNDGHGHFTDASVASGLSSRKSRSSMALADVNGDGLLDVYIAAYRTLPLMDMPQTYFEFRTVNGRKVIETVNHRPVTDPEFTNRFWITAKGTIEENGEGGDLYLNRNGTNFVIVPFTNGKFLDEEGKPLSNRPFDWELDAMFHDVNGDGAPDLYVCNDFASPDRLWINDGHGGFRAFSPLSLRKTAFFSMGVDFADVNRDGFDDFFLLDMLPRTHASRMSQLPERSTGLQQTATFASRIQVPHNTLLINRGDNTFAEVAHLAGLEAADWAWCPMFLDVDLDGWEDLLITNGNLRDSRHADWVSTLARLRVDNKLTPPQILDSRKIVPPIRVPNLCFRNRGDLTFEEVGANWGFHFVGISHGMAAADLDNDGDLDVVVNNLNDRCSVYRNNASAPRVEVRLHGRPPNTRGIGSKVRLLGGAVPQQQQEITSGGRYLSSDEPSRTFAAGSLTNRLSIEVFWRDGGYTKVDEIRPNCIYEIDEPASAPTPSNVSRPNQRKKLNPLFVDESRRLNHRHHDESFDDFARQPLQPQRLSQLGPGITWADIDGDGLEDLIIGAGRGGRTGVYRNDGSGGLQPLPDISNALSASRDQTTLLAWPRSDGSRVLLIGSASYEDGLEGIASVKGFDLKSKLLKDAIPGDSSSVGPLVLGDIDGDGDLDLFVGGRVVPGRYPETAHSRLFLAVGNHFELDPKNSALFASAGLVSDAVFSDIDGDGDLDLILACEWDSLRAYRNDKGEFKEVTHAWGLDQFRGWWNGVAVGDFDEDGKLDIVASNWGRNTEYQQYREKPLELLYGSLGGDGAPDIVEAVFVSESQHYAPARRLDVLAKSFPFLRERFGTQASYGTSSVSMVFGERLAAAKTVTANWLESTVFLNRGERFEAHPLPIEAQWSPAFAVVVGDLDGDGHEDLFLSQNDFGIAVDRSRLDAGRGLWLRGDGHGHFESVLDSQSGISVYGEGRGAALADYDGDGRLDLVVGQNGGETKLYHNLAAKPGVRIRLAGASANPDAIGAQLRWSSDSGLGPIRELHAGGGYWSQNSVIQIFPASSKPASLDVRWPGGMTTRFSISASAREVRVDRSGTLRVIR